MNNYENWVDNYIDILNIIFVEFLTIASNKGIIIKNNQEVFNDFCYMIYDNSKNNILYNPNNFDYIN